MAPGPRDNFLHTDLEAVVDVSGVHRAKLRRQWADLSCEGDAVQLTQRLHHLSNELANFGHLAPEWSLNCVHEGAEHRQTLLNHWALNRLTLTSARVSSSLQKSAKLGIETSGPDEALQADQEQKATERQPGRWNNQGDSLAAADHMRGHSDAHSNPPHLVLEWKPNVRDNGQIGRS